MLHFYDKLLSGKAGIYIAYFLCAVIWGTGWFAIRLSVGDGGFPLLSGAAIRYTIAAIVLLLLVPLRRSAFKGLSKSNAAWIIGAGVLNGSAIAMLYWGEISVSGGLAAVLSATSPILAAILAFATRAERITFNTIAGFMTALVGIALIFGERLIMSPSHIVAMLSVLGSALMFAVVNLLMKIKGNGVSPLQSALVFFLAMSVVFWAISPLEGRPLPLPLPLIPTCAVAFLALGSSVIALPAFFYLLKRSSLMFASTLAFVHPVIALLTDALFERNFALSTHAYIGMGVVLGGVLISMMKPKQPDVIELQPAEVSGENAGEAYAS